MCDPPRILPKIYPLFNNYMRPSQNLPFLPRIYSPFQQICSTLPEFTPPCQNIPPFLTTICDPPRFYPSLLEYTPFLTTMYDLPQSTPPSQNIHVPLFNKYMRLFQNLPLPPSQKIPVFLTTICNTPRIYPYIPEYTPLFYNNYMRPSQNLPLPPKLYPPPPSFEQLYICDQPRIYPSHPEYTSLSLEIIRFDIYVFLVFFKLRTTIGSTYTCDPNPPFKKSGDGPDQG